MSENKETPQETPEVGPSEAEQLRADLQKAKNDYLYLMADFDNYRKNSIKERSDLVKFGSERFVREFLKLLKVFLIRELHQQ